VGIDPKNKDLFQLFKKLKDADAVYPQDLLSLRRQGYLKQVAEISAGVGLAGALKNTVKHGGKTAGLPPAAGILLESVLVVVIVAEAGILTYFYRDKIKEWFQSISNSPKVQQISNPPVQSSSIPGLEISLTPAPSGIVTVAGTETPEVTPSLLAEQPSNDQSGSQSSNGSQAVSTPKPTKSNNGNKYGHTPIPQRTKHPGNKKTPVPKKN
jgi:hypothetical protein